LHIGFHASGIILPQHTMQRPNAGYCSQDLQEPMKVILNRPDASNAPPGVFNTAIFGNQNTALAVENARLLRENMLMRMRESQCDYRSMPSAPPGLESPWKVPEVQRLRNSNPSFTNRADWFSTPETVFKGLHMKQDSLGSDSTTSGDLSSFHSSTADDDERDTSSTGTHSRTTVMVRNLPNNLGRDQLLQLLNDEGFEGCYSFVYVPIDFKSKAGLGYAFIDFRSSEEADDFFPRFQEFTKWPMPSDKVCDVTWSVALQGIEVHLERYRNSPVMHESVPDEFRPVLFQNGKRVPFPLPTKRIRAPRQWPRRP